MTRRVPGWVAGYVLLLLAAAAYPFIFSSQYLQNVGILVLFAAYQGCAWNVLGGYTGLLSFGHAAFFGIGAYTSTLLFVDLGLTPWLGMLLGGVAAAAVGMGFGYLTVRYGLRGHYFALGMFAFAELLRVSAQNLEPLGGTVGILIPLKADAPLLFQFQGKVPYYFIILALLVVVILASRLLQSARWGYFWAALRSDDTAAEMSGVDTLRYKLVAMGLSAFFMALAGTFYAQFFYFIGPPEVFGIDKSLDGLFRAMIGGPGTVLGPVLGAMLLAPLGEITKALLPRSGGGDLLVFGIVLVLGVRFLPEGIHGLIASGIRRVRKRVGRPA